MSVIQIGIIGVVGVLLALQLRSGNAEYGIYVTVAVGIVVFANIVDRLGVIVEVLHLIESYIKIDRTYISLLLKMLGITYISEFACSICKDAGYQTIAGQIEVFAKLTILALSMPVLVALLQTIRSFLVV